MLSKVAGVLLAVRDAEEASKTFEAIFGTKVIRKESISFLGADVTVLGCGVDMIGLAQPTGPGLIADRLEKTGEGIVGVAFSTNQKEAVKGRLAEKGVGVTVDEDGDLWLDPAATHGLLVAVLDDTEREKVGVIDFLYEVTHLVSDWQGVSDFWTDIFGLEGAKFSPIKSDQYGYEGTLTLFDPPVKLDRIEVVYPGDETKAMGKFFLKRGEGPYMFFAECEDFDGLRARLDAAGARYAPKEKPERPNSLFIHPSATHGVLIGVSPKNLAWVWSGRPELARAKS